MIKAAALVVVLGAIQGGSQWSAEAAESPQPVFSTLEQLHSQVTANGRVIGSFRLEGVVAAAPHGDGMVVLQDDSAAVLLELPPLEHPVKIGDNLVLEGTNCTLTRGAFAIQVGTSPVVDVDGSHGTRLRSGAAFLDSGVIPVRVEWFNDYGPSHLQVEYEGPGVTRVRVPNSALWHRENQTNSEPRFKPGLEYSVYVGTGWKALPDFQKVERVQSGITDGFDISRRVRADQCALVFSGYLQVSNAGIYRFHVASDDGSRIFVGDPSSHCRVSTNPNATRTVRVNDLAETLSERGNQQWSELEGKILSVYTRAGLAELKLGLGPRPVTAVVINPGGLPLAELAGMTVRVTGIYQRTWMANESSPGRLLVPWPELVQPLDTATQPDDTDALTAISQIRALSPDQARSRESVRIRGIITTATPAYCILQDATGGIYLPYSSNPIWENQARPGEVWEFSGVTDAGHFAPIVIPSSGKCLGQAALPQGVRPTWSEFQDGSLDAEQVEIRAAVIECSNTELTLLTRDGTVVMRGYNEDNRLPLGPGSRTADSLPGSIVSIRGVYFAAWDSATRLVRPRLFQMGNASLSVIEAAPQDEFVGAVTPVRDLFLFRSPTEAWGRVKVAGVVLHSETQEYILSDRTRSIRIYPRKPQPIRVGDWVEAVGFPQVGGPSPVLLEAKTRRLCTAELPQPIVLDVATLPDRSHDAKLVRIEAQLLSDTMQQLDRVLELQAGQVRFLARHRSPTGSRANLRPGTLMQMTGVYSSLRNQHAAKGLDAFELLLARPDDMVVLRQAPWWTPRRILILTVIMAVGLVLATGVGRVVAPDRRSPNCATEAGN